MSATHASFSELISRVRAGDETAAVELVRRYEPALRRSVRLRLLPRLRRIYDSLDICQEVLGSFFVRAASGQYELNSPEQLLKLLATMARYKVSQASRRQQAACRDDRRLLTGEVQEEQAVAPEATPSRQLAAKELLQEAQRRLSTEERNLVEMRSQGLDWAAIAGRLGGNPEALRKRLARAVARVADELGLDEVEHG
jgi:RNA polymerase sigma-70 factor (ECF subfamily)